MGMGLARAATSPTAHRELQGQAYNFVPYGVDATTERIDYDEVRDACRSANARS